MFNILLKNHPSITAFLYQNSTEDADNMLGSVKSILLPGIGDKIIDMQGGTDGYRLFCDYDDFSNVIDINPEELGGYFFKIDNFHYIIEKVKILKTIYTNQIKFILLKNAS